MSTINSHPTFAYSQPEDYHFSHDSVFLARWVFEYLSEEDLAGKLALDLCAGCGVIGMDFLFHWYGKNTRGLRRCDFLEVQDIYQSHFDINKKNLFEAMPGSEQTEINLVNENYQALLQAPRELYDLILCNPPYFRPNQGKLSSSEFKNRCRFFLDSDFKTLILAIDKSLASAGRAFVLFRSLSDHGIDIFSEAESLLGVDVTIKEVDRIRGTSVVLIRKVSRLEQGLSL